MEYKHKLRPGVWVKVWKDTRNPNVVDPYTLVFYGRKEQWEGTWKELGCAHVMDERIQHFWRSCAEDGARCASSFDVITKCTTGSRPVPWAAVPEPVKRACEAEINDDDIRRNHNHASNIH